MEKLEKQLQDLKAKVMPKKKFAFSSAKQEKKGNGVINPSPTEASNVSPSVKEIKELQKMPEKEEEGKEIMLDIPGIENKSDAKIVLTQSDLKPAMKITNNKNCEIYLRGVTECIYIRDNENCKIFLGPTSSSIMIDSCTQCEMQLMAHQVPNIIYSIDL